MRGGKKERNFEKIRHNFLLPTYYTVSFESSKLFRLGGNLLWVVVVTMVVAVSAAIAAGLSSFCFCAAVRTASAAAWIAAGLSFCFCAAAAITEATMAAVARRITAVAVANCEGLA